MNHEDINDVDNLDSENPWNVLSTQETAQSIATERLVALAKKLAEEGKREGQMSPELIAAYSDVASQNEKLAQENESGRFKGITAESWGDLVSVCDSAKTNNREFLIFSSGDGAGIAYERASDDVLAATNPDKLKARYANNPNITEENFSEAQDAYYHIKDLHRFALMYDDSHSLIDGGLDGVLGPAMLDIRLRGMGYKLVGEGDDRHYEPDAAPLDEIEQGIKALEDKIEELKQEKQQ